jgi:hypothetical protein
VFADLLRAALSRGPDVTDRSPAYYFSESLARALRSPRGSARVARDDTNGDEAHICLVGCDGSRSED